MIYHGYDTHEVDRSTECECAKKCKISHLHQDKYIYIYFSFLQDDYVYLHITCIYIYVYIHLSTYIIHMVLMSGCFLDFDGSQNGGYRFPMAHPVGSIEAPRSGGRAVPSVTVLQGPLLLKVIGS